MQALDDNALGIPSNLTFRKEGVYSYTNPPMRYPRLILSALLFLAVFHPGNGSAQIYADVSLSGGVVGNFTITLKPDKAPVTVANFIGLATGQNGWLDLQTGSIRHDPFYKGVTFHRVVAGFVSQTGSPNGTGTDGPGYTFRNEIDPTLSHATPYTVAMANSGTDTNGSQWYITQGDQSSLDGNYTIFGAVTSGQEVCDALNAVTTNATTSQPITPVTISSIAIYGLSLADFNMNPPGLPRVLNGGTVMKASGSTFSLGFDHEPYSSYYGFHSPDLTSWSALFSPQYFHSAAPGAGDIDVTNLTASSSKHFYRMARVDYSSCLTTPATIAGKTLTFPGLFGASYVKLTFDAIGTAGTYEYRFSGENVESGAITAVTYYNTGTLYNAFLYVKWDATTNIEIAFDPLKFTKTSEGTFSGRSNLVAFPTVSGNFTSSP
jgi:peptidyl-prolyl cis-trans isomerase A (cyclophilin A)